MRDINYSYHKFMVAIRVSGHNPSGRVSHVTGQAPAEGLRVRKKRQTKEAIAAAAAALFAQRGYDAVTMVDVARAADVSEPTVYNHFPSKERLVFDRDDEVLTELTTAIAGRLPGTTVTSSLRSRALAVLDHFATQAAADPRGGMPYLVASSPELRPWMLEMTARWADSLASSLQAADNGTAGKATTRVLIRCLVGVYQVIIDEIGEGLVAGIAPETIARRLRPEIERTYDILEAGLHHY